MHPERRLVASLRTAVMAAGLVLISLAGPAVAQILDESLFVTDGKVRAVAASGCGVPISTVSGAALAMPRVDGQILAVVSDGAGGWFIAGDFSKVGGQA